MSADIFVAMGLLYGTKKLADAGQRAANRLAGRAERAVRSAAADVAAKAETVLMPCAHGLAAHQRTTRGEYYADGTTAYFCRVCGETME